MWPDAGDRATQRDLLAAIEGSDAFFARERPQEPGESPEPDGLP